MGLRAGLDWCGKSPPTGIRSPDRPVRRQSLYRLSYRAHAGHLYSTFILQSDRGNSAIVLRVNMNGMQQIHSLIYLLFVISITID